MVDLEQSDWYAGLNRAARDRPNLTSNAIHEITNELISFAIVRVVSWIVYSPKPAQIEISDLFQCWRSRKKKLKLGRYRC
jgi:hypothetical protein